MTILISLVVIFLLVFCVVSFLKGKPQWLVKLYFDIWEDKYPTKKVIDKWGEYVAVGLFIIILFIVIYFHL